MTEFQLLDIWSKFHCKVIVLYYTVMCAVMKAAKLDILFTMRRLGGRFSARTASAVSHLTHLAWENVMTDVTRGGRVCSYRPRPPTL